MYPVVPRTTHYYSGRMRIAGVYGLQDPRDQEPRRIRYVGKSEDCAWRLQGHLKKKEGGLAKRAWITDLLSWELVPIMVLLPTDSGKTLAESEREWILRLNPDLNTALTVDRYSGESKYLRNLKRGRLIEVENIRLRQENTELRALLAALS